MPRSCPARRTMLSDAVSSPGQKPATPSLGSTRCDAERDVDAVGERARCDRRRRLERAREVAPIAASPGRGVGPEIPVACASPPNRRAAAKSVSSSCALGAARTRRGRRRGRRAWSTASGERAVDVRVVEAREPRRAATGAAASPFADTISSTGPSCSYAVAPDRRVEGVADDERAGHDRGAEQRAEDDEQRLARTARRVAQREPAQDRLARRARRGTAARASATISIRRRRSIEASRPRDRRARRSRCGRRACGSRGSRSRRRPRRA